MFIVLKNGWTGYDMIVSVNDIVHVDAYLTHERNSETQQFISDGSEIWLDKSRSNGSCLRAKESVDEVWRRLNESRNDSPDNN